MTTVTITLNDDGTIVMDNFGAAAHWAQRHGKYLKIILGNTSDGAGDSMATFDDFDDFPDAPILVNELENRPVSG